jgi:hypothetical protein
MEYLIVFREKYSYKLHMINTIEPSMEIDYKMLEHESYRPAHFTFWSNVNWNVV